LLKKKKREKELSYKIYKEKKKNLVESRHTKRERKRKQERKKR
jgi:hypothetical protein